MFLTPWLGTRKPGLVRTRAACRRRPPRPRRSAAVPRAEQLEDRLCLTTCVAPPPDLLTWLPGEGNANDRAGSNHGTVAGATFASGLVGQALSFDGNDEVTLPSQPVASLIGATFTIEFWANPGDTPDRPTFGFAGSGQSEPTNPLASYDGALNFGDGVGGFQSLAALPVASANTWTHYAIVDDGTHYRVYVNGTLVQSEVIDVTPAHSNPRMFVLGQSGFPAPFASFYTGRIDEFTIYARGLTASEILGIVNAGDAGKCSAQDTQPPETLLTTVPPALSASRSATFAFTGTDNVTPPAGLTFQCQLDGGVLSACTSPRTYTELSEGTHRFQVQAVDQAGNIDPTPATFTWRVDTLAPLTTNVVAAPNPVQVGVSLTLTATLSDVNRGGSNLASAEYSIEGSSTFVAMSAQDGAFDSPTESGTATVPAFTAAGVYTFCVRGGDAAGNIGTAECILVAVFDPGAGFVTGGGWIDSSAGALVGSALAGRAHFGFNARYVSASPAGQTHFNFPAANLHFRSTAYEVLILTGFKSQVRGVGRVGDTAGYSFLLTAYDGDLPGGGDVDRFRLKIWLTGNPSNLLYDNVPGAPEDIDLANPQAIGAGNIRIHASALGASGGSGYQPDRRDDLSPDRLQSVVAAAVARWAAAGATPEQLSVLRHSDVRLVPLPGGTLGLAAAGVIWLSPDAAGHGWFVDPTPADDAEFAGLAVGPAGGRVDLLTVIAHEMGHLLGLEHGHDHDLMAATLAPGVRRTPGASLSGAGPAADSGPDARMPGVRPDRWWANTELLIGSAAARRAAAEQESGTFRPDGTGQALPQFVALLPPEEADCSTPLPQVGTWASTELARPRDTVFAGFQRWFAERALTDPLGFESWL